jgi:hypothetical protein
MADITFFFKPIVEHQDLEYVFEDDIIDFVRSVVC